MSFTDDYAVSLAPNEGWDERILVVRCGRLVNSFIVVSERYVILVDTLINPQTATELLVIAGEFLTNGRQLLVINSHADYDHCWGNQLFAGPTATYPAPILATRRCAERFFSAEMQETLKVMIDQEPEVYGEVQLVAPTILFDARQMFIDGGDLTLRLFATPGHQPDHIAIMIPEISVLLACDAAELPFPFAHSATAVAQLRSSLAQLASLNPATALYCHAPVTSGPQLLRQNIAYFDSLEQRCRDAMDLGVPTSLAPETDVVELIDYPLTEAVPPAEGEVYPTFYVDLHAAQIRLMLEYLGKQK